MSSALGSQSSGVGSIEPMPLDDTAVSSDGGADRASAVAVSDPYATLVVRVPEQLSRPPSSGSPSSATSRA